MMREGGGVETDGQGSETVQTILPSSGVTEAAKSTERECSISGAAQRVVVASRIGFQDMTAITLSRPCNRHANQTAGVAFL